MDETTTSFILQLSATLIGVGGGIAGGLWHDRRTRNQEKKETLLNTLDSILEELKNFQEGTKDFKGNAIRWNDDENSFNGRMKSYTSPGFESAVNSGDFRLLSPKLQVELGYVYNKVTKVENINRQIWDFHLSPIYTHKELAKREAERICRVMKSEINKLEQSVNDVIPNLLSEIKKIKS